MLSVDFETRGTLDLRRTGAYVYAEHPDTDVLCMAYALDDGEVQLWLPGDPVPGEFEVPGEWRAWNASFERLIYKNIMVPRYGFPAVPDDRWVCTAAEAAAMALPRSLDQAARALGVDEQKDAEGHRIMLQVSKPRRPRKGEDPEGVYWWKDAGKYRKLYDYCQQDVRVERTIAQRLRPLSEYERTLYLLDQKINDRGLLLDRELVEAARRMALEAQARINVRLREVTDGEVEALTNVQNIVTYLDKLGIETDDLRKQTVAELMVGADGKARTVLGLRAEGAKTSVAKLDAMLRATTDDGLARGLLLYHGASTGRWAGRLVQPHNFPRGTIKNVEQYIPQVLDGDIDGIEHVSEQSAMEVLSSLLRSMLIARPERRFVCADFAQIEARVLAWLAGQDDLVQAFADAEPIYETMAAAIYGVPVDEVTTEQRHVGKTAVLGAGFGMGWKKYKATVKDWTGEVISDDLAQLAINTYRGRNERIKALWDEVNAAALNAVRSPGLVTELPHGIKYVVRGQFLWCILPSKRPLAYALPKIVDRLTPWGAMQPAVEVSMVNSMTNKWERRELYGGWLVENIVQAIARDLMADSMLRAEQAGYEVVLTVHDEILAEATEDLTLEGFCAIMRATPDWATDIPVEVDGWEGERYRK